MLPHIRQQLNDKTEHDLTYEHQQAITGIQREHQLANAEHENQIRAIQHENVDLQGEIPAKDQYIAALPKLYAGYLANEDKNNSITISSKNNEAAEYTYISICKQHDFRGHKTRALLAQNQGSTLFEEGDAPNAIVTYSESID